MQSSGGRGEYEIVEDAPNGLRPNNLEGLAMRLRFGPHLIDTGLKLRHAQGKWRLRLDGGRRLTHVPFQAANVLLMPDPIRDRRRLEAGLPVLQTERYLISNVHLGDVQIFGKDAFVADAISVEYRNQSYDGQQLSVAERISSIERVWKGRDIFPGDIPALLKRHEAAVRAGTAMSSAITTLVRDLQRDLASQSADLDIEYSDRTDPVPAMLEVLGQVIDAPLVPPEEIEPEQIDVRRREVKRWQQWVSRRGAASVAFRRRVREAYNARCLMCGGRFPPTEISRNPGIDSAHIVPWSKVDLDEIYNGVALCKLHHWAFDEGLLVISCKDDEYFVEMPASVAKALADAGSSVDILRAVIGKIPVDHLPVNKADRPHPELLARRREFTE